MKQYALVLGLEEGEVAEVQRLLSAPDLIALKAVLMELGAGVAAPIPNPAVAPFSFQGDGSPIRLYSAPREDALVMTRHPTHRIDVSEVWWRVSPKLWMQGKDLTPKS